MTTRSDTRSPIPAAVTLQYSRGFGLYFLLLLLECSLRPFASLSQIKMGGNKSSLTRRIQRANTAAQKAALTEDCRKRLTDTRVAGLPLENANVPLDGGQETTAPTDVVPYDDLVRAVCYLAASPKPARLHECPKCHSPKMLPAKLAYGKDHAGEWYHYCQVRFLSIYAEPLVC